MAKFDMNEFLAGEAEIGRGGEDALMKALSAGFGTDAAEFAGGRAMIPESCETTLMNVMREMQADFKVMNTIKKTPVASPVHQFNVRTDVGDEDVGFVAEGASTPQNAQEIARKTMEMGYIQKMGAVTEQMLVSATFEDAYEVEKVATTISVLKTAEKNCFHGDRAVVGKQFSGFPALIQAEPESKRNILDLRGQTIGARGEGVFMEMAEMIYDKGGEANKVFYPLILAEPIQALCRDRLRFGVEDGKMAAVFKSYPTLFGNLSIAGDDAGPDKLYFPKGVVKTSANAGAPGAPSVKGARAASPGSKFLAADAGNVVYEARAVNEFGTGPAAQAVTVAVSAGDKVTLEIENDALKPGTGYVISRSRAGDPSGRVMELARIPAQAGTTVFTDLNEDLPGTAQMLFITEKKLQQVAEFFQYLPMRLFRMYPTDRLVSPFVMALWGAPVLKAPHWCGLVKNVGYPGGLYG